MDDERARELQDGMNSEANRCAEGEHREAAAILAVGAVLTEMLWGIQQTLQGIQFELARRS